MHMNLVYRKITLKCFNNIYADVSYMRMSGIALAIIAIVGLLTYGFVDMTIGFYYTSGSSHGTNTIGWAIFFLMWSIISIAMVKIAYGVKKSNLEMKLIEKQLKEKRD